jgi:hypothetical protein
LGLCFSRFSLFINDIVNQISFCGYYLLANDVQLYMSCRPAEFPNCIARLNKDLSRIHLWTFANQISINSSKSQALIFNPNTSCTVASPQINLGGSQIAKIILRCPTILHIFSKFVFRLLQNRFYACHDVASLHHRPHNLKSSQINKNDFSNFARAF